MAGCGDVDESGHLLESWLVLDQPGTTVFVVPIDQSRKLLQFGTRQSLTQLRADAQLKFGGEVDSEGVLVRFTETIQSASTEREI